MLQLLYLAVEVDLGVAQGAPREQINPDLVLRAHQTQPCRAASPLCLCHPFWRRSCDASCISYILAPAWVHTEQHGISCVPVSNERGIKVARVVVHAPSRAGWMSVNRSNFMFAAAAAIYIAMIPKSGQGCRCYFPATRKMLRCRCQGGYCAQNWNVR